VGSAVQLTFSQPVSAASADQVRLFGSLRGQLSGSTSGGGTARIAWAPAGPFRAGEQISVSIPATVLSTGGAAAAPQVLQFTAATRQASGNFTSRSTASLASPTAALLLADVDQNGSTDILAASDNGTVSLRLNDGTGVFTGSTQIPLSATVLAVGDVDGDGDPDLLAGRFSGNTISVRLNNGAGQFGGAQEVSVSSSSYFPVAAVTLGDVDADGDLDLLAAGLDASVVAVRLNDGTGQFGGAQQVGVGTRPVALVLGDWDNDGDLDLATASNDTNRISVRLNDGHGGFSGTQEVVTRTELSSLRSGDVDADGDLDLLAGNKSVSYVSVRTNDGTGQFGGTQDVFTSTFSPGNSPSEDLAVGDVDGDGDLDLATANFNGQDVSVRYNDGAGTFGGGGELLMGPLPLRLTLADADGNGTLDLLVANYSVSGSGTVRVWTNTPPPPVVSSFTPGSGQVGASVTLTGQYFTGVTAVTLGGVPVSGFAVNSASSLTAVVPPGVNSGNFCVTTPDGTGCSNSSFQVTTTAPDLVVSTAQAVAGGTYHNVTVTGTGAGTLSGPLVVTGTLTVQARGVLDTNCQPITGSGAFELQADAELRICAADGLASAGAGGAVQISGPRTYSPQAYYTYNGTTAQVTGAGLPAAVRQLTVSNPAGLSLSQAVAVAWAVHLQRGDLRTNGQQLTLRSTPSGTALVDNTGGLVVGPATVERYISSNPNPGRGYRHLAAPTATATVADLNSGGYAQSVNAAYNTSPTPSTVNPFPTVFAYDQTRLSTSPAAGITPFDQGWLSPGALSDALPPGQGYTVNMPGGLTLRFTGPLTSGAVSRVLTRGPQADAGWHLLGNPYPSTLDWTRVAVPTGLEAAVYTFRSNAPYTGQYRSYVNGVGDPLIPLGQAFFVRVAAPNTSVPLTMDNAARLTEFDPTLVVRRGTPDQRPQLRLRLRGTSTPAADDEATVYFEAGATPAFDARFDARRIPSANPGASLAALSSDGQLLSIAGLPPLSSGSAPVALQTTLPATGAYELTLDTLLNFGTERVWLEDALTGLTTELRQQPTYAFTATAGTTTRFSLRFTAASPTSSQPARNQLLALYPNPATNQVQVRFPPLAGPVRCEVLNAVGQRVAQTTVPGAAGSVQLAVAQLPAGLYWVQLRPADGTAPLTQRLVIQH
jgi:hypothetical protein